VHELVVESNTGKYEEDVMKSPLPAAVYFYSDECPPCEAFAPIFERLAEKFKDHVKFVIIHRQKNKETAEKLGIKSSPTVLFFKNGEQICQRLTGYICKDEFTRALEAAVGGICKTGDRQRYECDALILGAGPAGLTAAIYLARAKLKTIVVDEGLPGGQVSSTFHVANYPGVNGVIRGSDLMGNMIEKALSFGAAIDDLQEVVEVDLRGDVKYIKTEDTDYYAKCVILCTGAQPRKLPADGEREYRGRGVHYCATCDGAMYQDRKLVVVGGGNSAVQEAMFLTKFASHVTLIHQFDVLQASQVAQDELLKNPEIDIIWDSEIRKIEGEASVKTIEVENTKTKQTSTIPTDGVFVYIGMQPATQLVKDQVELSDWGYILANEQLKTNLKGVFSAGDVRDKPVRQIATAVGDGAVAGKMAEQYIVELNRAYPN